jgi:ribonucleoside-diphosphate reductase alpha chain
MTELPTPYQGFIHLSRYSRWLPEEGRRESWTETVDRYINFMCDVQCEGRIPAEVKEEIRQGILNLEIMPSMRCMMTAGEALARDNVAGFNCSYVAIDHQSAFDEVLYILMCGTGVGFSVEKKFVRQLPVVAERFRKSNSIIKVEDSKIGWAEAYRELVSFLYSGVIPKWDVSKVRPSGERLKTFGGRASGPQPLVDLFNFTVKIFTKAAGRRLHSIECHDLCCKIGEIVVVGGVRRSAEISLSDIEDDKMRHAKSGDWFPRTPWRALANNSACYNETPSMSTFMNEWHALYESNSGERGIFNRVASQKQAAKNGRRDADHDFGTNPCSEIILRSAQFCNLSEVVVRPEDTFDELARKIRLATIMGTMQSSLTNFRYLRDIWRENTEEEALLGVSLTGIMDHEFMSGRKANDRKKLPEFLEALKAVAVETNKEWAPIIGVNRSTAITCVKPSGTVSQLVGTSSGIHCKHAHYFIRRVRADKKDPLAQFMKQVGFPCEDDVYKPDYNYVFSFPMKAPKGAYVKEDLRAIDHLEIWKIYQDHWCEHKPSVTIDIKEHEWMDVGAWTFKNIDLVSGVSFLPDNGGSYAQTPFEKIGEKQYEELLAQMPEDVDWKGLTEFELEDTTTGTQEFACTGGACELVDLVASE